MDSKDFFYLQIFEHKIDQMKMVFEKLRLLDDLTELYFFELFFQLFLAQTIDNVCQWFFLNFKKLINAE